jgi:VanZ family protein
VIAGRPPSGALRAAALAAAVALVANLFIPAARPEIAGLIPAPWDKVLHLSYFLVVAVLLMIAEAGRRPLLVLGIVVLVGAADEWHQAFLPDRESSVGDFLADCVGAAIGVLAARRFSSWRAGAP